MQQQIKDRISGAISFDESRISPEGYLWLRAKLARTGIQEYLAGEVGKTGDKIYRIYRPPEEVMNDLSVASFINKPVTDNHPNEWVTPDNFKSLAVGFSGDKITKDGDFIVADLTITDRTAIDKIKAGKVEISNGYSHELDWTAGVTPKGEAYDAVQRKIRGNHIALVDAGRCGSECSLQTDASNSAACNCNQLKDKPMTDKTIFVDGIPLMANDQMAAAVTKIQNENQTLANDCASLKTDAAAKDAKIATLEATIKSRDTKITELTNAAKDETAIEVAIDARLATIDAATKITGKALDAKGKSTAAIKAIVVKTALGDVAKDYSNEQVSVAFDVLLINAKPKDVLADAFRGKSTGGKAVDKYTALNVNQGAKNAN